MTKLKLRFMLLVMRYIYSQIVDEQEEKAVNWASGYFCEVDEMIDDLKLKLEEYRNDNRN